MVLDGKGDYVRVPDNGEHGSLDFHQGDPITIEAWIRLDSIRNGQNVYIVGKGRTHLLKARENQNFALRMRGVSDEARLSFLFRSQASESDPSQWHRWTTSGGIRADGIWHHVAISYRFGDSKTIKGYLDGKSAKGKWDMDGPTDRAPVVDDDELWIGSSMGGSGSNSFCGAIDELLISRKLVPGDEFKKRRVPISHAPKAPASGLSANRVHVRLYEDVGSEAAWPMRSLEPLVEYEQNGFGFSKIPYAYGRGGVRRDWSGPVMMLAMAELSLGEGDVQWMLRAGGLSRLWINDEVVLDTPAHLKSASGHGAVKAVDPADPWLRPPRPGHFEESTTHHSSGTITLALETMIGGKSIRYEPGEILVAYRTDPAEQWQLVRFDQATELTDSGWLRYAADHESQVQAVDDAERRRAASKEDEYWSSRHEEAKRFVASLPQLDVPSKSNDNAIDYFIQSQLNNQTLTGQTSDHEFIRRLYLDCLGVVPSVSELEWFVSQKGNSKQRRARLIDRVLTDSRWADHWTSYWMDVLAENPNVLKPTLNNTGPFRFYLNDVLRDNVAIDRWVSVLLRMEGSKLGGGPAGFAMAAQNDVPMAAKAHVATSAFLGANMKCARCHDAPYHEWTQKDLFGLAAMLKREPIKVPATSSVPKEFFGEEDPEDSLITLSLSPGDSVDPSWSLASYPTIDASNSQSDDEEVDTRDLFAEQLTRPQNQQFSKTIVNRLWKQFLGEGLVEPVDDWEGAEPSHPELLEYLARELASNEFDVKHVAKLILNSDTYGRTSSHREIRSEPQERRFASPRARRMSAEQIVDSMHVVIGRPMDCDELTFDPEARMKPTAQNNLGRPARAWQLTSLSNERDRPALSLPRAAAVTECLEAFGWKASRQEPVNHRPSEPNVIQPGILANGLLSIQLTRLTDEDELTQVAIRAKSAEQLVEHLFQRFLTREPTPNERKRFVRLLKLDFDSRMLENPSPPETPIREPFVSWANHLHPDATDVRLREAERLRQGPTPSRLLDSNWRERLEDAVWALINTPEFIHLP